MSPQHAADIDNVFLYVLDTLAAVKSAVKEGVPHLDRDEFVGEVLRRFNRLEASINDPKQTELMKYAFVCWIDEVFIDERLHGSADWANTWKENTFEFEVFEDRESNRKFFLKADEAATLSPKDALEVFVTCVMLGFRGMYGVHVNMRGADVSKNERSLIDWISKHVERINLTGNNPKQIPGPQPPQGPMPDTTRLSWWMAWSVTSATIVTAGWIWFLLLS